MVGRHPTRVADTGLSVRIIAPVVVWRGQKRVACDSDRRLLSSQLLCGRSPLMRVTLLLAAFAPAAAGRVVLDPEAERGANPSINVAARRAAQPTSRLLVLQPVYNRVPSVARALSMIIEPPWPARLPCGLRALIPMQPSFEAAQGAQLGRCLRPVSG